MINIEAYRAAHALSDGNHDDACQDTGGDFCLKRFSEWRGSFKPFFTTGNPFLGKKILEFSTYG